jgi:hypothetical protein
MSAIRDKNHDSPISTSLQTFAASKRRVARCDASVGQLIELRPSKALKGLTMLSFLKKFFADVEGSTQGLLNPEELYRSILTSLGSGTLVGVLILLFQAILTNTAIIFPNPSVASLATIILTLILDLLRRQNQGPVVSPVVPSVPTQNPVAPAV